jgi:outer membrane protein OmpA-like peptidoglycan-associated protein
MPKAALFALALLAATPVTNAFAARQPLGVVYFTEWSALLDDAATGAIKTMAADLAAKPGDITVTGYADTTGSNEANDLLSKLRAQMVIDLLKADGVPASRLKRADKGSTPDIGGANESRRVLISIDAN